MNVFLRYTICMEHHRTYFETAYRTGSDAWSHLDYQKTALQMLPKLHNGALVLDVGSGRGLWPLKLVELGYKVIGIDYIPLIVQRANERIKEEGIADRARFMVGDVLDIPLADQSFDAITDIGLLQHLDRDVWGQYAHELSRTLKNDGYVLNVSFSRETTRFMGYNPSRSDSGAFEKFGLHYYFFTEEEIAQLFKKDFLIIEQRIRYFDTRNDPDDGLALVFTLMQKK